MTIIDTKQELENNVLDLRNLIDIQRTVVGERLTDASDLPEKHESLLFLINEIDAVTQSLEAIARCGVRAGKPVPSHATE